MLTDPTDGYLALAGCLVVPGLAILVIFLWRASRRRRWHYGRRYPKE